LSFIAQNNHEKMKIIGQHTCSKTNNIQEIEQTGPFLSTHVDTDERQHKFLGTGYYFWDNNIGMAHAHGQRNYKRKYYIFESELHLETEFFLDLAGNRMDMLFFQELMAQLKNVVDTQNWTLAHFIEFLKRHHQFPYRAIRAIDSSINPKEMLQFVPNRPNSINLNPVFIVCLLDNRKDMIKSFKHLKTFPDHV
jgi:hypothetical protein